MAKNADVEIIEEMAEHLTAIKENAEALSELRQNVMKDAKEFSPEKAKEFENLLKNPILGEDAKKAIKAQMEQENAKISAHESRWTYPFDKDFRSFVNKVEKITKEFTQMMIVEIGETYDPEKNTLDQFKALVPKDDPETKTPETKKKK